MTDMTNMIVCPICGACPADYLNHLDKIRKKLWYAHQALLAWEELDQDTPCLPHQPRSPSHHKCIGRCGNTGWVLVHEDNPNDEEGPWHDLWCEAEHTHPSLSGFQFVKCPKCDEEPVQKDS